MAQDDPALLRRLQENDLEALKHLRAIKEGLEQRNKNLKSKG